MYRKDIENVQTHIPELHWKAMQLSADLGKYWGRDEADFYTKWGRLLGQDSTCETCKF